jgi:hypothetical protein
MLYYMNNISEHLSRFINESTWVFAKTYAKTWPHEYIVQEKVDNEMYTALAKHIDTYGHKEYFYKKQMIYYYYENHAYWHMGNIINRCLLKDTYQNREKADRLPKI